MKKIIVWLLIATFLVSSIPVPGLAQTGQGDVQVQEQITVNESDGTEEQDQDQSIVDTPQNTITSDEEENSMTTDPDTPIFSNPSADNSVNDEVYGEENNTVIEDVYGIDMELQNLRRKAVMEVLSRINTFNAASEEEKQLILEVFQVDEETISIFEEKGYSLLDAIQFAILVLHYDFSIAEIEQATTVYKDFKKISYELIHQKLAQEQLKLTDEDSANLSLMSSDSGLETDYDKYFSAPYDVKTANDESIDYNSGRLSIEKNLLSLPGRNQLDLNVSVRYDSAVANFYDYTWRYWPGGGDPWIGNYTSSTAPYLEARDQLGPGWSFGFSSIEIIETDDDDELYLHLGDGRTYKVNFTSTAGDSNLKDYPGKDLRLETDDETFTSGYECSAYVLIHKDGKKEYFGYEGKLLGITDRYNNTIKFEYTTVSGNSVILITDTLNRVTKILYENTSPGKKVTILEPDSTPADTDNPRTQLFLELTTVKYVLTKIVDQKNRETTFNYNYDTGMFNFFDGGCMIRQDGQDVILDSHDGYNTYANLTSITYPTSASSSYTFEKTNGNLGEKGIYEYYRVNVRKDLENGSEYNKKTFSYSDQNGGNNYTGYPSARDPNSLPSTLEYSIQIADENNRKDICTFNNKHLKIKEENKITNGETETLLKETTSTYDTNKLPDLVTTVNYGYAGDNLTDGTQLTKSQDYDYNEYGDLLRYLDEQGAVTEYQYEANYHQKTLEKRTIDQSRWAKTEYGVNSSTGNVEWMKQYYTDNGTEKTINTYYPAYDSYGNILTSQIEKENGTRIQENYEYSATYNHAYLTKKYSTVTDYTGSPEIIEENYTYNLYTGRLFTANNNGQETKYYYDELGRQTKIINPDLSEKNISYNDTTNTATITLENNFQARNLYDGLGRLVKKQEIKEGQWVTTQENHYNALSQVDWTKDGKNNNTRFEYDIFGRVTKTINPDATFRRTQYYDTKSKKIEINEENAEHAYFYDQGGNLIKETVKPRINQGEEYTSTYAYDYLGRKTYQKDPQGSETYYTYDELGRLTTVQNAQNEITRYQYNHQNQLTKIIQQKLDSSGNQTGTIENTKEYDELGRLIKSIDPSQHIEYIKYDRFGNITHKKDRLGQIISYTYDTLNRPLTETAKDTGGNTQQTITYNYTRLNTENILTITDSRGMVTYEFYANGKLKKETQPDGKNIYYEYDQNGNKSKMVDPYGLSVDYTYDQLNRLDLVTIGQTKTFDYDYYNDGMLKSIKYPNTNIVANYTYDDANRLNTLTNTIGTENTSYSYGYDANSNITSVNDNGSITNYQYDPLNRLEIIDRTYNNQRVQYSYDNRGNRTEEIINFSPYPLTNAQFTYNVFNQLTQYNENYFYQYDYRGLRTQKKTVQGGVTTGITRYFNDSIGRVIAEADINGNATSQIIWADKPLAIKKGNAYYYYIYNGHGDVVKLVNESGTIVNSYTYDEWGNILSKNEQIANPIRYAAGYYDEESGLYYLMARYYDPTVGRFISEDSVEGQLTNPLSLNRYVYAVNNPVIYNDPNGNIFGTIIGGLIGGIIGGISAALHHTDIGTGIISGAVGGAIAGAAVDITIATGGTALVPLAIGSAVGGGVGAMAGNAIDQVGNRWNWGYGENLSYVGSTLNYGSMVTSGIIGLGTGALSGYTGYGIIQAGKYGESLFSNAAKNALTYGDNITVENTMAGIYRSAYNMSNSLLRADVTFTSLYNMGSSLADYYVNSNYKNNNYNYNNNYNNSYNNSYNYYTYSPYYSSYNSLYYNYFPY